MKKTVKAWALLWNDDELRINTISSTRSVLVTSKNKHYGQPIIPISITYEIPKRKGVRK